MKQAFGAGQQGSAAVPITAGITALGAGVYYMTRSKPDTTPEQDRKARADAKKAEGLGGAGIGGNAVTGGHELSHVSPKRKEGTTAPPEKLPSGGVGGGVGGGGSNVRTSVEMSAKENPGTSSPSQSGSGFLGGLFGTGGSKTDGGKGQENKDTRVASNIDGTPSKQNTTHHNKDQPSVPKSGGNDSSKGKSGGGSSGGDSASQSFQGAFGQGGANVAEKGDQSQGFRDPR
ncbi:hypothetical protein ACLX1H_006185 [Fusarium chlamydosporum]